MVIIRIIVVVFELFFIVILYIVCLYKFISNKL